MKVVLFIVAVFNIFQIILGESNSDDHRYCFQFTWLGQKYDENSNNIKVNCSIPTPCVEPFVVTDDSTSPNVTHMWYVQYADKRSEISCPLISGYVCIKYSYSFNNAVLNTTYFCGKMIEDKTSAINSGCYKQKVDGYIIEVCACQSNGGHIPCNSTSKIHQSFLQIIMSVVVILISQQIIRLI